MPKPFSSVALFDDIRIILCVEKKKKKSSMLLRSVGAKMSVLVDGIYWYTYILLVTLCLKKVLRVVLRFLFQKKDGTSF